MLEGLVEIHGDLEEEVPHREVLAKQTGRLVARREKTKAWVGRIKERKRTTLSFNWIIECTFVRQ